MKRSIVRAAAAAATAGLLLAVTAAAQPTNEAEVRKAFAVADVNSDGAIDVNEYVAQVIYIFKRIDANGDGYIRIEEWAAYNPGYSPDRFKDADRDGDGRISLGEAVAVKMIEFFAIDTNHDGVITIEEILAYERTQPTANVKK